MPERTFGVSRNPRPELGRLRAFGVYAVQSGAYRQSKERDQGVARGPGGPPHFGTSPDQFFTASHGRGSVAVAVIQREFQSRDLLAVVQSLPVPL